MKTCCCCRRLIETGVEKIRAHLIAQKTITVAQVRDLFNTSRKYALALMEYLDAQGVTKRQGDERVVNVSLYRG